MAQVITYQSPQDGPSHLSAHIATCASSGSGRKTRWQEYCIVSHGLHQARAVLRLGGR